MTIEYGDLRLPSRFWSKVDRQHNGCWHWTAYVDPRTGYGHYGPHGPAHRHAFHVLVRPLIPRGQPGHLQVDHECHNRSKSCQGGPPCLHRRCVNPAHLAPRTPRENTHSSTHTPAAVNRAKTHCSRGHELAGTNLRVDSHGRRNCYTCKLEKGNEARRRRHVRERGEAWSKVEHNAAKTHCARGHEFAGDNLIVGKSSTGRPTRICRTCRDDRAATHYARKVAENPTAPPNYERTHCPHGHEYSEENTYRHRGRRSCRTCRRESKRAPRTSNAAGSSD